MEIKHEEQNRKGVFYIDENGERLARLEYFVSEPGHSITIYHTEVDDRFRGEGIGADLVAAAVTFARTAGVKIVAKCPYAKKVFERTPEFQDVLE